MKLNLIIKLIIIILFPCLSWGESILFCHISSMYDYEVNESYEFSEDNPLNFLKIIKLNPEKKSFIEYCIDLDTCMTANRFPEVEDCNFTIVYSEQKIIETSICNSTGKTIHTIDRYTLEWLSLSFKFEDAREIKTLRQTFKCKLAEKLI